VTASVQLLLTIDIHRSGALEVELGRHGVGLVDIQRGSGGQIRIFRLVTIIGWAWAALALYSTAREPGSA
jgi:hypothetical protein